MEVIRRRGSRLRSGAGVLVVSVAVAAAVTGGYFGLRHVAVLGDPGSGPAARAGAAMAYDPTTGDVVLFGGDGASGQPLGDTWLWDGSSWSQATPADSPPARYGAQMAWDPQSQRVILLGGTGGSSCSGGVMSGSVTSSSGTSSGGACTQLQDAWAWDGSDWAPVTVGQAAGQLGYYTLAGASMATDPAIGKIVLVTADSPASDGVSIPGIYNSSEGSASAVPVSSPTAEAGSTGGVTGSTGGVTGSAGGVTGSGAGVCIGVGGGPCDSPVALPSATATTAPVPTACPLDGGCTSTACPVPAGAQGASPSYVIACPVCPVAQGAGGSANIACPVPCSVSSCVMCPMTSGSGATNSATGSEVTCSNCAEVGEPCALLPATLTWVFDGSSFQKVAVDPSDAPESGGDLVWFPGPGRLVDLGPDLYAEMGGPAITCPSGAPCPIRPAAEDWAWTGSGWTSFQVTSSSAAAPFFGVAPVTDTAEGDAVGLDAADGTWVSTDPTTGWTQLTTADTPGPRSGFALAYDGGTGQVVLFGGDAPGSTSTAGGVVGDTWTWDGTDWTEQEGTAPSSTPSGSAMPVPTATVLPSLPPLPSASAVAGSAPPTSTPAASASATPGTTSPAPTPVPSTTASLPPVGSTTTG